MTLIELNEKTYWLLDNSGQLSEEEVERLVGDLSSQEAATVNYYTRRYQKGSHQLKVMSRTRALEAAETLFDWVLIADYPANSADRALALSKIYGMKLGLPEEIECLCGSRVPELYGIGQYLNH